MPEAFNFFILFRAHNNCPLSCALGRASLVHGKMLFFSFSGLSVILTSGRKQTPLGSEL